MIELVWGILISASLFGFAWLLRAADSRDDAMIERLIKKGVDPDVAERVVRGRRNDL